MKKFLGIGGSLAIFALIMLFASSYTGRPMFGVSSNQDNTGRQLTYGATTIADTAGSTIDTILIVPENYEKYYTLNLVDSAVVAIKSTRSAFNYSKLNFIISKGSGTGVVKFLGYSGLSTQWLPNVVATSTYSVTASRTAVIRWICTGTKYAEIGRSQD